MSSKIKSNIIISGISIVLLICCAFIYFQAIGVSSNRQTFENQVKQYISEKYPELTIVKQSIRYSFIDMNYHSTVQMQSGNQIEVTVGYNYKLQDNYNR